MIKYGNIVQTENGEYFLVIKITDDIKIAINSAHQFVINDQKDFVQKTKDENFTVKNVWNIMALDVISNFLETTQVVEGKFYEENKQNMIPVYMRETKPFTVCAVKFQNPFSYASAKRIYLFELPYNQLLDGGQKVIVDTARGEQDAVVYWSENIDDREQLSNLKKAFPEATFPLKRVLETKNEIDWGN